MNLSVLIVEDEPIIVMDLQMILEDAGHSVVGRADTMREALRLASLKPIDVALVDIELMSGPDGVETAERLRAEHGVMSLFITGRASERARAMACGCEPLGFIVKPFDTADVLNALRSVAAGPSPSR